VPAIIKAQHRTGPPVAIACAFLHILIDRDRNCFARKIEPVCCTRLRPLPNGPASARIRSSLRDPTPRRRYFEKRRTHRHELSVECRPSVHQDEAGKSTVRMDSERNPAIFSPITIEPIAHIQRSDFRKFGKNDTYISS
jgi:hypothetical protein